MQFSPEQWERVKKLNPDFEEYIPEETEIQATKLNKLEGNEKGKDTTIKQQRPKTTTVSRGRRKSVGKDAKTVGEASKVDDGKSRKTRG